jgi:hypothetical protein
LQDHLAHGLSQQQLKALKLLWLAAVEVHLLDRQHQQSTGGQVVVVVALQLGIILGHRCLVHNHTQ